MMAPILLAPLSALLLQNPAPNPAPLPSWARAEAEAQARSQPPATAPAPLPSWAQPQPQPQGQAPAPAPLPSWAATGAAVTGVQDIAVTNPNAMIEVCKYDSSKRKITVEMMQASQAPAKAEAAWLKDKVFELSTDKYQKNGPVASVAEDVKKGEVVFFVNQKGIPVLADKGDSSTANVFVLVDPKLCQVQPYLLNNAAPPL